MGHSTCNQIQIYNLLLHLECNTMSDLVSETFFLCMLDANSFSCGDHGHLALNIIHLFNQFPLLKLEGGPKGRTSET